MSVRGLTLPFLAVLWLWPAVAYGQSPALMDAYKRAGECMPKVATSRPFRSPRKR